MSKNMDDMQSLAISIKNLTVLYHQTDQYKEETRRRPVLKHISFDVERGSWIALVGKNGSGKSTLAKAISGLCEWSEGNVVFSHEVRTYTVLQNPKTQVLGDTIFEEMSISFGEYPPIDIRREIRRILDEIGLLLHEDTPTKQLSGGELQLLNIACCMAAGANLFILDEVTSMLDHASREGVMQAVQYLHAQGATIIWLTHRAEELVWADRIVVLDQGEVAYTGTPRHFFYGDDISKNSPCELYGMELPYVVQVVKQLQKKGYSLPGSPLLPHELGGEMNVI